MNCACKHDDARACLLLRHPEIQRHDDVDTEMYDAWFDEKCECGCHAEAEAERREFDPYPWEIEP